MHVFQHQALFSKHAGSFFKSHQIVGGAILSREAWRTAVLVAQLGQHREYHVVGVPCDRTMRLLLANQNLVDFLPRPDSRVSHLDRSAVDESLLEQRQRWYQRRCLG